MQSSAVKLHTTSHSFFQYKPNKVSHTSSLNNPTLLPCSQIKQNISGPSITLNPSNASFTQGPKILSKQIFSKQGELPHITPVFVDIKDTQATGNLTFNEFKYDHCSKQSKQISLSSNNNSDTYASIQAQQSTFQDNSIEEQSKSSKSFKKQTKLLQLLLNTDSSQQEQLRSKYDCKENKYQFGRQQCEELHQYQYKKGSKGLLQQYGNREQCRKDKSLRKIGQISERIRQKVDNNTNNIIGCKFFDTDSDIKDLNQKISNLEEQNKRIKNELLDCQYAKIELTRKYDVLEKKYVRLSSKLSVIDHSNLSSNSLVINQENQTISIASSVKNTEINEQLCTAEQTFVLPIILQEKKDINNNIDRDNIFFKKRQQVHQNLGKKCSSVQQHTEYQGENNSYEMIRNNNLSFQINSFSKEGSKSQQQLKKYF